MASLPRYVWDDRIELLLPAALTASTTKTDFPTANVQDRREFSKWKADGAGGQWFRVDMGASVQVKAMGIAGHNFNTLVIPNITLTADDVGGAGHPLVNTIVAAFTPATDRAIVKFFDDTYRYWELTLPAGSGNEPEMGVFFLAGDFLEWENSPNSPIDPDHQVVDATDMLGGDGHLLGSVTNFVLREFGITYENLTHSFVQNTFWPFNNTNGRKPFFALWDPTNRPDEVSFVRMKNKDVSAVYQEVWQTVAMQLSGVFDDQ